MRDHMTFAMKYTGRPLSLCHIYRLWYSYICIDVLAKLLTESVDVQNEQSAHGMPPDGVSPGVQTEQSVIQLEQLPGIQPKQSPGM